MLWWRRTSAFFFSLSTWLMYSQSRIGIGDSKSKDVQKKVAAHRHFLLHWFSFLCQGEGNTGRIASIGSIYWAESGKDWVDLLPRIPDLRVVNISFFLSFFPKLAVQENRQKKKKKKKKKRRSSSDSSFAQHKQSNLRPLTCSSKPKQPRPLADQTFTDKTITRKQRSRGSSE